ncbi:hypothetical protein SMD44_07355 [Streptomyces alboflavus]|uniref:Uncharacterized protein n=1 Tax=Streptomyces alboflavus TaxID=67267 RepID=A0A1Z1WN80_9ACTN|nr:hypothetical protein [Streptomyces alboflavus]ARX87873.1 hypothetical protein SMD44_07355 [Streptomyces alboflavus]
MTDIDAQALTDDEREALGMLARTGAVPHQVGVRLSTMLGLEKRGLVLVTRAGARRWVAELTEEGKPVAERETDFTGPVDVAEATSAVAQELWKAHPENGLSEVHNHMSYESADDFRSAVQSWVGDRSELPGAVIGAADYDELYADFIVHNRDMPEGLKMPESPPYFIEIEGRGRVQVPEKYGTPLLHVVEKDKIVGFRTATEFWSLDVLREILKGLSDPAQNQVLGDLLTITLPEKVVKGLFDRDSFTTDDPLDVEALAALTEATYSGRGKKRVATLRGTYRGLNEIAQFVYESVGVDEDFCEDTYGLSDEEVAQVAMNARQQLKEQRAKQ